MDDKKNIDRLFQEKFKDFEVTPNDAVWEKIKARKNDDRKRILIIPFWYRIAGVAALVAVILSVGSFLLPDTANKNNVIVTNDNVQDENVITPKNPSIELNKPKEGVVNQEASFTDGEEENMSTNNEALTDTSISDSNKTQPFTDNINPSNHTANKHNTSITSVTEEKQDTNNLNRNDIRNNTTIQEEKFTSDIATVSKSTNSKIEKQNLTTTSNKNELQKIATQESTTVDGKKQSIIDNDSNFVDPTIIDNNIKEAIASDTGESKEIENPDNTGKKSIFDAIKEKENKEKVVATADPEKEKRWNIAPNVAPVYYDSFGGSSIDPQFSDNTKQGEVNLSYGIQVAYAINKRLIVRSGVSKVDVGYNTEDVGFGIAALGRDANGAGNTQSIVVSDYRNGSVSLAPPPGDVNSEILVTSQNPGLLNHSIGYIEVPLELKYALTDSKMGIHMIGGVSTLFLESDEVSVIAGSFRNDNVSREQTVNDVSFSGNIGIGFDYKLSDQFKINMEPIFKYQFNGFRDNAQNFRPYYFGVYTGVSFRF
ncbi:hypothetical protein [uncultured Aquimarina sp.]|uniref:hypothetical protein n=1 Tax=uncultured Aquimarina sp. TaxID=575652 RepID=UPI00260FBAB7|nr:hypothetical protein [uncultured Aquimarina sp.]